MNLDSWTSGLAEIRVNGYGSPLVGLSPSLPWARSVTSFGLVNNFPKTFTHHIVRFGLDISPQFGQVNAAYADQRQYQLALTLRF